MIRTPYFYDAPCIVEQAKFPAPRASGQIHGIGFHNGEYAMAIRWYEQDMSDSQRRTFHLGDGPVEIFNCCDLRSSKLKLRKLPMPREIEVHSRRSARVAGAPPLKIQNNQRWEISPEDENRILAALW